MVGEVAESDARRARDMEMTGGSRYEGNLLQLSVQARGLDGHLHGTDSAWPSNLGENPLRNTY